MCEQVFIESIFGQEAMAQQGSKKDLSLYIFVCMGRARRIWFPSPAIPSQSLRLVNLQGQQ